jgi:hypothetical protein
MDDYRSKPLRMQELGPMLAKWLPLPVVPAAPVGLEGVDTSFVEAPEFVAESVYLERASDTFAIWNPATLPGLVGDNRGLHQRLLTKFLFNAPMATQSAPLMASQTAPPRPP